ncbi:MAG: N-methyl-L-tryptophan oxidase [Pseudomonadota bacterium]
MPYDIAVVGSGVIGAAVAWQCALRGLRTVLVDRYCAPHDHGSSHGQTRLLRVAYAEGEKYVPLARRAVELWHEIGHTVGEPVFHQTGVVYVGQEYSDLIQGARRSAAAHDVALHDIDPQDRARRIPELRTPPSWSVLIEDDGGYLRAEASVQAMLALGERTTRLTSLTGDVRALAPEAQHVVVTLADGQVLRARQAVVAASAWTGDLLPSIGKLLEVRRQLMHWFEGPPARFGTHTSFRPFAVHDQSRGTFYYGFPRLDDVGVKVADHYDGLTLPHAEQRRREVQPQEVQPTAEFVRQWVPGLGRHLSSRSCLYTCTASEDFVLDEVPGWERVYACTGFSGHGFKFAPAIGEAVAQRLAGEAPTQDTSAFRQQ